MISKILDRSFLELIKVAIASAPLGSLERTNIKEGTKNSSRTSIGVTRPLGSFFLVVDI